MAGLPTDIRSIGSGSRIRVDLLTIALMLGPTRAGSDESSAGRGFAGTVGTVVAAAASRSAGC